MDRDNLLSPWMRERGGYYEGDENGEVAEEHHGLLRVNDDDAHR
jgi:hypothetical protein